MANHEEDQLYAMLACITALNNIYLVKGYPTKITKENLQDLEDQVNSRLDQLL